MYLNRSATGITATLLGLLVLGACGTTTEAPSLPGAAGSPTTSVAVPGNAAHESGNADVSSEHVTTSSKRLDNRPAAAVAKPEPAPVGGTEPAATAITTRIIGLPDALSAGSTTEFSVLLTNDTKADYPVVAPVFVEVGGPGNSTFGSLSKFDEATHAWIPTPMPAKGDDVMAVANNGFALNSGDSETVRYRLALTGDQSPGQAAAVVYTVYLPARVQVGLANQTQRIIGA